MNYIKIFSHNNYHKLCKISSQKIKKKITINNFAIINFQNQFKLYDLFLFTII